MTVDPIATNVTNDTTNGPADVEMHPQRVPLPPLHDVEGSQFTIMDALSQALGGDPRIHIGQLLRDNMSKLEELQQQGGLPVGHLARVSVPLILRLLFKSAQYSKL